MIHMSHVGNQYADKVFSEHPIALWSLDEHAYYLSLINDNARLFSNWTLSNATHDDSPTIPDVASPFNDDVYSSITANTTSPVLMEAESADLFGLADMSIDAETFCVNLFLYQKPTFINWFKVGYRYNDVTLTPQEVISDPIYPPEAEGWINLNEVYQIPSSISGDIRIFIQVDFSDTSGGDASSRTVIMNGLSIGQNSETTCYESLGSTAFDLPTSIGLSSLQGISADQYGVLADNGYYVVRNNRLLAKNDGFPMVFGTNQSTKIYPSNVGLPSFIFPGKGMLNEAGRNKNYTLEMWLKVDASTSVAKRIVGPLSGNNGLYIKEGFLTLVIGSEIASHCVGEWYRPMLVHLEIRQNNISVIVNGETVINIDYDRENIDLPNDTDWWGIYSYPEISMFQVDCISIYPYIVSEIVAKRRFVYGQGTPSIESLDDSYFGTPTTIDFSTSEYSSNVMYPDIYRWDAGYFNNLNATRNYLSVPNYSLPIVNLGGRDLQLWYEDNYQVNTIEYPLGNHPKFITFRPNIDYSGGTPVWNHAGENYIEQCYFNFPSLNVLNNAIAAVYGIFEIEEDILSDRTLMSFVNITNGDTFDITVNSDSVSYSINGTVLHTEVITIGLEALIGLNLESSGTAFGYEVSRFFSSPASVQLYVGGNGQNTFEGKIYVVGFSNQLNYETISSNFDTNGVAISENYEVVLNHIASYTLLPEYEYGQMFLDISVASVWEEYFPLNVFAGYVKDENGDLVYDLDLLQINVGYSYTEDSSVWYYQDLLSEYASSTYADLGAPTYANYLNLNKNNTSGETLNVSNSSMQSYITFQSISDGANLPLSSFNNTKGLATDNVIYSDNENTVEFPYRVYDTKFVFKDNTVIYPPKVNSFEDYAMVLHFDVKQRAILRNPLKIRNLQISSKNINYVSLSGDSAQRNIIGTKFGSNIYPQIIDSGAVDYKEKNPLTIYKTNTPYLYTTKKSGIKVVNETISSASPSLEHMASINVNSNASYQFYVGALQFFVKGEFTEEIEEQKLMDINYKDGKISLTLDKRSTGNFIKAYINDGVTLTEATGISFYQNGKYVTSPSIINNEWNAIGISFAEELDFSEYSSGSIDLFGGFMFNNISYYLSKGLGIKTELTLRDWENVLNYDSVTRAWSFWDTGTQTWKNIYVLGQSSSYFSTPEDVYKTYTGTNKSIVDDNAGMRFSATESKLFTEVSWTTLTDKPA